MVNSTYKDLETVDNELSQDVHNSNCGIMLKSKLDGIMAEEQENKNQQESDEIDEWFNSREPTSDGMKEPCLSIDLKEGTYYYVEAPKITSNFIDEMNIGRKDAGLDLIPYSDATVAERSRDVQPNENFNYVSYIIRRLINRS